MSLQFSLPEKSSRNISEFELVHHPKDKFAKLGEGSFATVKLAKEKATGKLFALKITDLSPRKCTASDIHNLKVEITLHRKLSHPNIIKFHDYMHTENFVYVILDVAENGNLYHYHQRKKQLTEAEIFRFFYQTCLAVDYLHKNNIMHRDIKPENILLDKELHVKLCDFGWATQNINDKRVTFCGTYEYMAPEIVHKTPYDYRVDIWSLGVLLFELIHRAAPYRGRSLPEITRSLAAGAINFSKGINPDAKDLILSILKIHPSDRLTMQQIFNHPWVTANLAKNEQIIPQPLMIQSPMENPKTPTTEKLTILESIKKLFSIGGDTPKKGDSSPTKSPQKDRTEAMSPTKLNSTTTPLKFHHKMASQPNSGSKIGYGCVPMLNLDASPAKSPHKRKITIFANEKKELEGLNYPPLEGPGATGTVTMRVGEDYDYMSFGGLTEIRKRENLAKRHFTTALTLREQNHKSPSATTTHLESKASLALFKQISAFGASKQPETPIERTKKRGIFENTQLTPINLSFVSDAHLIVHKEIKTKSKLDASPMHHNLSAESTAYCHEKQECGGEEPHPHGPRYNMGDDETVPSMTESLSDNNIFSMDLNGAEKPQLKISNGMGGADTSILIINN